MPSWTESFGEALTNFLPQLVAGVGVLVLGCLVALVLAAIVRGVLRRGNLSRRISKWMHDDESKAGEIEGIASKFTFYLVLLFVLVAFLQVLGLTLITEPINNLLTIILEYAPRVVAALTLLLLAWVAANVLRIVTTRALSMARVDERLGQRAGLEEGQVIPLSETLGNVVYWLVFVLFLPAILTALAIEGLLGPVQEMLNQALGFLPNLFAAAIIVGLGWFAARIVQKLVANLLAAIGLDRLGERGGLKRAFGDHKLSEVIGFVLYILILIPVLIAALNALELEAITAPASRMLEVMLGALPNIFAAALLLLIAYVLGRLVAGLVAGLLSRVGFDGFMARLGLGRAESSEWTPSQIVGTVTLVAVMLFASMEAAGLLGFAELSAMLSEFMVFLGHVVLGLIIFGVGLYLANLSSRIIASSDRAHAGLLAMGAKVAILLFAGAMALREIGLANEIITLAFGLCLGAVAVALAIAFGVGGRGIAEERLRDWLKQVK